MNTFIHEWIKVVKRYPERLALVVEDKEIVTYYELFRRALKLSQTLSTWVGPNSLVALNIPKSADYIVAILATWMRGAAFMPLDPSLPLQRQHKLLEIAKPNILLKKEEVILPIEMASSFPEELAYIIFTSGSTGEPKGVMISHEGIISFLSQQITCFALQPTSRALWTLSLSFDASISDIGTTLLAGATLCIENEQALKLALNLPKLLKKRQITHLDLPPSLLQIFEPEDFSSTLETLIIGGEVCPISVIQKWSQYYRLINVYGPTEATVCTSMKDCTPDWSSPNIGKPISGIVYTVRDKNGQEVAKGKEGELYIAGIGLALGYINNALLTAEKFVYCHKERYYRTGDLVYENEAGEYIFIGRKDRQVKINGQLIALEEIETLIAQIHGVERVAVLALFLQGRIQLVAFIQERGVTQEDILIYLKSKLPDWMVPGRLIFQNLPLTSSQKVDLSALEQFLLEKEEAFVAEISEDIDEQKLQMIWKVVLRRNSFCAIDADFFCDLGGDSLAALEMILLAEQKGLPITIERLSQHRTIKALVKARQLPEDLPISAMTNAKLMAFLAEEMQLKEYSISKRIPPYEKGEIFLSGATGFLGIFLLRELLKNTDKKIVCLVRAKTKEAASQRIKETANLYQISFSAMEEERIVPILGDLNQPQLGLLDEEWHVLSENISDIFHCAATVNLYHDFQTLKAANTLCLRDIVHLSCLKRQKKIHYISTLSVFVSTDKKEGICKESDNLASTQLVYGGYAQSKWAADRFLYQLKEAGLPINIFRVGLITGHSESGVYATHDFLNTFVQGIVSLGYYPAGNWQQLEMDVTPVDYAAKAITVIAGQNQIGCYHIANQSRFNFQQILKCLKEKTILKAIANSEWNSLFAKFLSSNAKQAIAYLSLCRTQSEIKYSHFRVLDLFQSTNFSFDMENTITTLRDINIVCPPAETSLLKLYIEKMLDAKQD